MKLVLFAKLKYESSTILLLHDGPFRWVWRLHKELEPSTRAAVRGPEGPLMGATRAELIWGQFLLQHPPA